ncbi:MAG TPA: ABC transporter ATP-binding protein [Ramlibacter sp.]|nr:ABC transporter ATP-binding protein [Ramlibacter sp.]
MSTVLSCRDLSVRFGGFTALDRITADFEQGRTCAIIGPNGAGKTTLINALSGILKPADGAVVLNGKNITLLRPDQRARLGMGRSFQIVKVFTEMTARENLRVAAQQARYSMQPFWLPAGRDRKIEEAVQQMLETVGLAALADLQAGFLSHGKQRALELGLTLINEPSLLLLDEPLAGVGHAELPEMTRLLQKVRRGRTTIIIEHNMDAVMSMADEIIVLVAGQMLVRGTPADVSANQQVRTAYLGH